jgi:hypothetical protein
MMKVDFSAQISNRKILTIVFWQVKGGNTSMSEKEQQVNDGFLELRSKELDSVVGGSAHERLSGVVGTYQGLRDKGVGKGESAWQAVTIGGSVGKFAAKQGINGHKEIRSNLTIDGNKDNYSRLLIPLQKGFSTSS